MMIELTIVPKKDDPKYPDMYKQLISLDGARIRKPLGTGTFNGPVPIGAQIYMPNNSLLNVAETYDEIKKLLGRNLKKAK